MLLILRNKHLKKN